MSDVRTELWWLASALDIHQAEGGWRFYWWGGPAPFGGGCLDLVRQNLVAPAIGAWGGGSDAPGHLINVCVDLSKALGRKIKGLGGWLA